jgi:hypothetical protein
VEQVLEQVHFKEGSASAGLFLLGGIAFARRIAVSVGRRFVAMRLTRVIAFEC